MSTPAPRDHRAPGDYARTSCERGSHMAAVYRASRWRRRAACTCGWSGARRFLRGSAVVDALLHAAGSGHEPALPLVVDTLSVEHLQHESAVLRLPRLHLRGLHPR
jgi:hypothetical protein